MIRHEKTCKKKKKEYCIIEENILLKQELEEIKTQLKLLINQQCKQYPTTINKINKINKQLNINNININNNINIIQLGKEELHEILTQNEKIDILENKKILENIIKHVHFNDKYRQFKNILITNQQNNIAYKYDEEENKFIATDKNILIEDLIEFRLTDLKDLLEKNEGKLKPNIINKIDGDDIKYYENKKQDIKLLVYNNRNKITSIEQISLNK